MPYFKLSNGEQLYYEDTEVGEKTLVLVHGWSGSREVYDKPVKLIGDKARCITYDHRGHGKSKDANGETVTMETLADDLHELLVGFDLENIILLGYSMGAGVAMTYLERYGTELLSHLILCDMTPKQLNDGEWKLGLYQGAYTAEDMVAEANKPFFDLYMEFSKAALPKLRFVPGFLLKKPLEEVLEACDEDVLKSLAFSMKTQDLRGCIAALDIPLTYFFADPGSLFSPGLAEWYGQTVPTAYKSVAFERATHLLIEEQPKKFASEVAALL